MVREDWIKNDETFTNPLEDECEEDFEDRFQEVTKENVFKVKDDTPANPYDRDGEFLRVGTGDVTNPDTCVFKLSKEAVSNVWWPLKATKKGSGKLTTALLVFMNSTLGIVHMLGERLETRGL